MNPRQRLSRCRIISITSARPAPTPHPMALLCGQRAVNLAELARSIAADSNLCYQVTEAACQEFGWAWLNVDQAIVLLGRQRLTAIVSIAVGYGRSASQLRRVLHANRTTPEATFGCPEDYQEESK